ncbi:hypothetical protein [Luteibacter yeojuensis]|uniref:Uncharacterized protein n=1 Tax=Luteibacter yeojuensis TaxID=345309 RepID=A0A7X5TQR7_9GAMM|nr:hypothetical protein [Luteibacter yeojuensis]NID16098.1 hypothetical protein [Luteibacter yeojuensis]
MARHLLSDVLASLRRSARLAEDNLRRRKAGRPAASAQPRLAELAIEFDCRMTPRWNERRRCADTLLHMGRGFIPWLDRRPVHRVRIVCHPGNGWHPAVQVDGRLITTEQERN